MTYESAEQFFSQLGSSSDSRATNLTASYRFDIDGAGSWRVDVDDSVVTVSTSQDPADCVIATDEGTFLGVVNG